jgi:branched-chain amino acid transport system permease protein
MNAMLDWMQKADAGRVLVMSGLRQRWAALPGGWRFALLVAFIVLLYSLPGLELPLITTPDTDFTSVLFLCAVYVLVAVGLNVVIGLAGLLDLGYIGFYAVGAYTVAILGSPNSPVVVEYPWVVCVPIAIAVAMLSGVILGWPTLRLRGDYLAIVTLGFGEIIRVFALNSRLTNGNRGITGVPTPAETAMWPAWMDWFPGVVAGKPIFSITQVLGFYWLALTFVIIFMLGVRRLERSRVGRSWLAIREDEEAAEVMGVNTFKYKLWAFAIGAAIGGLSGALFFSKQTFINAEQFDLFTSILWVAAVVIGGAGNQLGVAVGAILLAYLPERFRAFFDYRLLVFGLALIVMTIFRPQGLLPSRRRTVELKDRAKEAAVVE